MTPYRAHEFIDFYTVTYMESAVKAIGSELFTRNDITPQWRKELDFMASHFTPIPLGELTL